MRPFDDVAELASGQRGRDEVYGKGDVDGGMWWASQAQGLIDYIGSVDEVVRRIMDEARTVIDERILAQSPR